MNKTGMELLMSDWADVVEDEIVLMHKQMELLVTINDMLDCHAKAREAIGKEEAIAARFWAERQEDYERCKQLLQPN